jgi:hypothetical protein
MVSKWCLCEIWGFSFRGEVGDYLIEIFSVHHVQVDFAINVEEAFLRLIFLFGFHAFLLHFEGYFSIIFGCNRKNSSLFWIWIEKNVLSVMKGYVPFRFFSLSSAPFAGFDFCGGRKFSPVTTLLPVFASSALRAFFAIAPPFVPAFAFSFTPFDCSASAIWRVES